MVAGALKKKKKEKKRENGVTGIVGEKIGGRRNDTKQKHSEMTASVSRYMSRK